MILYNPGLELLDNIRLYSDSVGAVYAIDNSETPSPRVNAGLLSMKNVQYLPNNDNLGVARALNSAAELAIRDGYEFLLTMDQDSKVTPGMVDTLLACRDARNRDTIGIIAPRQIYASFEDRRETGACEEILTTMTSGNLLSLAAYKTAGPFLEKLYIDFVDHEYCMRLTKSGFKIIRANNAVLHHNLGAVSEHRLFCKRFAVGNHPPLRRYYGTRNKFYLHDRYRASFPDYFRSFYKYILYELATIIIYEKNKMEKLRMIMQGYRDYKKGVYGKYKP